MHLMLDKLGTEGELVIDPNDRSLWLMHQSQWWCITGLSVLSWPQGHGCLDGPNTLRIVSGLWDVVTVRISEVLMADRWPTFVLGPPKQNLGVSMPLTVNAPDGVRVRVYWKLLDKEDAERRFSLAL